MGCSRQQHVRQVDASDQQNQANYRHQACDEGPKPKLIGLAEVGCVAECQGDGLVGRRMGSPELAR